MFYWNADKIRFLSDAALYTSIYEDLAARAEKRLPQGARVCDMGCGLGYLSLALARRDYFVTAADVSSEALDVLRDNLKKTPYPKLEIWEGDVFSMPDSVCFDAMVFCFFGAIRDTLQCARTHCKGKLILFKKNWQAHRFTINDIPLGKFTFSASCAELDELNIPYESESFELEMGQPFRSLSDAALFFKVHDRDGSQKNITEKEAEAMIRPNDSPEFPYYLPMKRPVGMIVLNAGDIPDFK